MFKDLILCYCLNDWPDPPAEVLSPSYTLLFNFLRLHDNVCLQFTSNCHHLPIKLNSFFIIFFLWKVILCSLHSHFPFLYNIRPKFCSKVNVTSSRGERTVQHDKLPNQLSFASFQMLILPAFLAAEFPGNMILANEKQGKVCQESKLVSSKKYFPPNWKDRKRENKKENLFPLRLVLQESKPGTPSSWNPHCPHAQAGTIDTEPACFS